MAEKPLRVALHSGVVVRHDAISNCVMDKLRVLDRCAARGQPVEVTVFTHYSDLHDRRIRAVRNCSQLISDPAFRAADVHCFEFGIYYDLFETAFVAAATGQAKVAVYHNITPLDLVDDDESQIGVQRSFAQKNNLDVCDVIACDSEFNRDDLVAYGIDPKRLRVLHPPPALRSKIGAPLSAKAPTDPLRLLFIGRMVRAKGVVDLVSAVAGAYDVGVNISLGIVGSRRFAHPSMVEQIESICAEGCLGRSVELLGELDYPSLAARLQACDSLVLPSYHEGYCVPVVEALSARRFTITSDAGNLPRVTGGLGAIAPVGDVATLRRHIVNLADRLTEARASGRPAALPCAVGDLSEPDWRQAVGRHLLDYDEQAFERNFLSVLHQALQQGRSGSRDWLAEATAA